MRTFLGRAILPPLLALSLLLIGCAGRNAPPNTPVAVAFYQPQANGQLAQELQRYAPWFMVEDFQDDYNRIGAPTARVTEGNQPDIFIDTNRPTIYAMTQKFSRGGKEYTNLIYRVHFPEVPMPNLTQGRNVGLLVYVTINSRNEPVLITTLHTCGCYLAMVPTSNLPGECWPEGWPAERQEVYGEHLPAHLELPARVPSGPLVISLQSGTHRVRDLGFKDISQVATEVRTNPQTTLEPMSALEHLPCQSSQVSLFAKEGWRKGYVQGSSKPLEGLLMGWLAFDPLVGTDKALGPPEETGTNLYTSLKFWARKESNIWNFTTFLEYWGWKF